MLLRASKDWLHEWSEAVDTMPIPDFQSLMLLIMKIAGDGTEHTARELRQRIGEQLGLTAIVDSDSR
jgi:hypothetical protein